MGYYTDYTLSIIHGDDTPDLIAEFRYTYEGAMYALDECGDPNNNCKWYDHNDDLTAFSESHPNAIFLLSGEGEESGDIWRLYVKNGKSINQRARMVYDDFDLSDLDEPVS